MAYFDHIEAERKRQAEEKFKELKKLLQETRAPGITSMHHFGYVEKTDIKPKIINVHDYAIVAEHIQDLESENSSLKKKVEKYQNFFQTMAELFPRQSSIHDVLN